MTLSTQKQKNEHYRAVLASYTEHVTNRDVEAILDEDRRAIGPPFGG